MNLLRDPLFQALLVTIVALWLLGGILLGGAGAVTWALFAFAALVAARGWWRVARRGDRGA